LGHRFPKHEMTRYARNLGEPWPSPGYAYAREPRELPVKSQFMQSKQTLAIPWKSKMHIVLKEKLSLGKRQNS